MKRVTYKYSLDNAYIAINRNSDKKRILDSLYTSSVRGQAQSTDLIMRRFPEAANGYGTTPPANFEFREDEAMIVLDVLSATASSLPESSRSRSQYEKLIGQIFVAAQAELALPKTDVAFLPR